MVFTREQVQEAIDGLREKVAWFPDIRLRPEGMLELADMLEWALEEIAKRDAEAVSGKERGDD